MKKPSILVLILSLILGVVYLTSIHVLKRDPVGASANGQMAPTADSVSDENLSPLSQLTDAFYNLKPGHYSSEDGAAFREEIARNKAHSKKLAEQLQNDPSIAKRLLGLFIQLEANGYTAESERYALAQESILFGTATARWLYLHQQFDTWTEFLDTFSSSLNEEKGREFISYVFEPFGSLELPASFGLFGLGEVGVMEITWLLDRSNFLQTKLKNHLLTSNVSAIERNKGLIALKKTNHAYFQESIDLFISEVPVNSPTYKYLTHLRDRPSEYSMDSLETHLAEIASLDAIGNHQIRSVEVVLDAVTNRPTLPVDDATLKKLEEFLTDLPGETQSIKLQIASIGYARWLAQSR